MTKIISTDIYGTRKTAIIRSASESFEIVIDSATGITCVWQAQYKKLMGGYEREVYPKLIIEEETKSLSKKYHTPKDMIENYMNFGNI